ncbi:MAG: hypothetical protein WA880_08345, partial [Ornithinimicrobium sp.]
YVVLPQGSARPPPRICTNCDMLVRLKGYPVIGSERGPAGSPRGWSPTSADGQPDVRGGHVLTCQAYDDISIEAGG